MAIYEVYSDYGGTGWYQIFKSDSVTEDTYLTSLNFKQEVNKASGLDFVLNIGHRYYNTFTEYTTFIYLFREHKGARKCLFRGRVSEIKTDIFGQKSVSCEGDLTILSDSVQSPNTFINVETVGQTKKKKNVKKTKDNQSTSMTVEAFFRSVIATHNNQMLDDGRKQFEIGTISAAKRSTTDSFDLTSYSETSKVLSSDILGKYGGIISTRYDESSAKTYIDWIESYSGSIKQTAKFSINLLDLEEEFPNDNPWSVLLPIGKDGLTISGASSSETMVGVERSGAYLKVNGLFNKYGRIIHYEKFDDATKADDLLHKAYTYLIGRIKEYPKNIKFKAVDLIYLDSTNDPIELGDIVQVDANATLNILRDLPCISLDLDILNPENNSYTIGSIMPPDDDNRGKASISSRHASSSKKTKSSINSLNTSIDGLQRDVNTLGNNVNVNAQNIAATAKEIAVVAENLAIEAENISIAANTIDIKASELTAKFEDGLDDVYTEIEITKEGISTKVEKDGVISAINQSAESITINANRINLEGYVTASDLSATNAALTNLTTGRTEATQLTATSLFARNNLTIGINDDEGSGVISYNGSNINKRFIKLIGSDVLATVLGTGSGDISLAHSHSVSVNDSTGRVTLGGTVAANSGGSFRIADTKTYKDGVSAVQVNSVERNGSDTYNPGSKNTTVHIIAKASNGNSSDADFVVSGVQPWNAGYLSGQDSVYVGNVACYNSALNEDRKSQTLDLTITLNENVDGSVLRSTAEQLSVGATDVYNAGQSDGISYALDNMVDGNCIQLTGVTVNRQGSATVNVKFKRESADDGWSGNVAIVVPAENVIDNHN